MWTVVVKFNILILLTLISLCKETSADPCLSNQFRCDGYCIPKRWRCDGEKDCVDGSDERNCDPCENMACSQNCEISPTGPQCYCNDGFELDAKDNKTCIDVNECLKNVCNHICVNTLGSYRCLCRTGFKLVNQTCISEGAEPILIFANMTEVRGMRLRSKSFFSIRRTIGGDATLVNVDPRFEEVYWVEYMANKSAIYSGKIFGSGFKTVLDQGLLIPEGIAVDYVANNLYITDSGLRQILVCKTDGTMCSVLHDRDIEKPRSIVLNPEEGFMYWSDWGEHFAGIYKSGMDGSRRSSLVSNHIRWPNGIALDLTTNRLYWIDSKLKVIESVTLDGRLRKVILNSTTIAAPFNLAVFEDSLYWSEWLTSSLKSCNKFTGQEMTLLARGSRYILGVHIYHPVLMVNVHNPCLNNDCSHMCLISPGNSFHCACPRGFKLTTDEKTCIFVKNGASLFVSEGARIFHIIPDAVGSDSLMELHLELGDVSISSLSYNSRSGYLFVADAKKPAIYAVNMTSQKVTSLPIQDLERNLVRYPEDLAVDWKSNNLYWIEANTQSVEVMNVRLLRTITLLNLRRPVALAISPSAGHMFVATLGEKNVVTMYGMDGKFIRVLDSVNGMPAYLALHPSKSLLYWADPKRGAISFVNYTSTSLSKIVKDEIDDMMSLAVSEDYIYWTNKKRELNMLKENFTFVLSLPGQERSLVSRKVTFAQDMEKGFSGCLVENGGCSYMCLTSPSGRTCACPTDIVLSSDNRTCEAKDCDIDDFKCPSGRCIKADRKCDGKEDCEDGSDEAKCNNRCSEDSFQCKDGRCIPISWTCDHRNDCADESDEQDCLPKQEDCKKGMYKCEDGNCIYDYEVCDGHIDCQHNEDEMNCTRPFCEPHEVLCSSGRCILKKWICDGDEDCPDGSDEKNCEFDTPPPTMPSIVKSRKCENDDFICANGECIPADMKCDGSVECNDGSDEINCEQYRPRLE